MTSSLDLHITYSVQASDRSPAKTIVSAVPKKGRPKYDFLRQLAQDLINSQHGPEHTDPVWNLLQLVKEKQAPGETTILPGTLAWIALKTDVYLSNLWAHEKASREVSGST